MALTITKQAPIGSGSIAAADLQEARFFKDGSDVKLTVLFEATVDGRKQAAQATVTLTTAQRNTIVAAIADANLLTAVKDQLLVDMGA